MNMNLIEQGHFNKIIEHLNEMKREITIFEELGVMKHGFENK